jgi:hypothetical protein
LPFYGITFDDPADPPVVSLFYGAMDAVTHRATQGRRLLFRKPVGLRDFIRLGVRGQPSASFRW